jgi:N-acetylglucosaminyldiphosphoundecaprenol N-acetyl-beta-D-mannosaminyltransferase
MNKSSHILEVEFNTSSEEKILEEIFIRLNKNSLKTFVVTPNPELVMLAHYNKTYRNTLNSADFSLPDGIGILWASKHLKQGISHRITGIDFMKKLCSRSAKELVTIGLYGAEEGIAEQASDCLRRENPNLKISYVSHTWDESKAKAAGIDILFVALGSPKQEEWIGKHLDELPVKVVMGVGGAFDMISGKVKRAPTFMRALGLEWLWRLIIQPWRIKRQLKLVEFVWLVVKEGINRRTTRNGTCLPTGRR